MPLVALRSLHLRLYVNSWFRKGHSCHIEITCGLPGRILQRPIRLKHIYCPSHNGRCEQAKRRRVRTLDKTAPETNPQTAYHKMPMLLVEYKI